MRISGLTHAASAPALLRLPGRRGCYHPRSPQIRTRRFLASGSSCESFVPSGVAVSDPGRWQWVPGQERVEFVPEELLSSRSPFQPLVPSPHDLEAICLEPPNIPRDTEVGRVTIECRRQPSVLFANRLVSIASAPVLDRGQRAGKATFGRCLPHHVLTSPRLSPRVR